MDTTNNKRAASAIAILLTISLLMLISIFGKAFLLNVSGLPKLNGSLFFINRLSIWLVLVLLWCYARYCEKQKFLVWNESRQTAGFYILSVVILLAVLFFVNVCTTQLLKAVKLNATSTKMLDYIDLLKNNIPLLVFTALTAAVVEELIFRGFIQTRSEQLFNSPAAGILFSSFLFAVVHLSYGTIGNFIIPFFIGIIFAVFYRKYKNIEVLMICHFIWDIFGLVLSIKSNR